jgi:hypothetical protein
MVALSQRNVTALTLVCGLAVILAAARPGPAAADEGEGTQSEGAEPCIVGHRFEPGPIVNGHYRQPTRAEFEARMRELQALKERSAGSCSAPSLSPKGGDMASGTSPAAAPATPKR